MKTDLFQPCDHCCVFQIRSHIQCSTLIASSFSILNNSAGIPSPPLALLVVMLHTPGCLALGEWSHHHGYLGHQDHFLYSSVWDLSTMICLSWLTLHGMAHSFIELHKPRLRHDKAVIHEGNSFITNYFLAIRVKKCRNGFRSLSSAKKPILVKKIVICSFKVCS